MGSILSNPSGVIDQGHYETRYCKTCDGSFQAKVNVVTIKGTHSESFCMKCKNELWDNLAQQL